MFNILKKKLDEMEQDKTHKLQQQSVRISLYQKTHKNQQNRLDELKEVMVMIRRNNMELKETKDEFERFKQQYIMIENQLKEKEQQFEALKIKNTKQSEEFDEYKTEHLLV